MVDAPPVKADLSAWLAVAAGTLGALMATLDISIVNSALPTIQGEIGASGTEGTWVATSYLVAEIVIIPLAAWLQRVLGLRTFLLIAASLFTFFSMICGWSDSLTMMIIGRVGQGFTGGALIPTAQTIIAMRLPREQQPIGIAAFGVTALLLLLILGLPHEKSHLGEFAKADWFGIAGLALGLGGLTVLLEEGQREQWFSSELIREMAAVSALGFISLFIGQKFAARPVIQLKLLLDRQFGAVAVMGLVLGMVLYGTSYVIPQFLASVANYNALQSGKIVLISGVPSLFMMAIVPILLKRVDVRLAVFFGLLIMGVSSLIDTGMTMGSDGSDFVDSQLMRGVGQILGMLFLSQACVRSVPRELAGDASGLFNSVRNLGGSIALAGIAIIQDNRIWLHTRRLEETLHANSALVQEKVRALGGLTRALPQLEAQLQLQALVMTYNDIFRIMGYGTLIVLPLVLLLRPFSNDAAPDVPMH
jgi:DHA2 family multidrug resistance protein